MYSFFLLQLRFKLQLQLQLPCCHIYTKSKWEDTCGFSKWSCDTTVITDFTTENVRWTSSILPTNIDKFYLNQNHLEKKLSLELNKWNKIWTFCLFLHIRTQDYCKSWSQLITPYPKFERTFSMRSSKKFQSPDHNVYITNEHEMHISSQARLRCDFCLLSKLHNFFLLGK